MLKRTAKHNYTTKMSRQDADAARMSGVIDGQQDYMSRLIARHKRDTDYEKKRLAIARMSGKGWNECLRRGKPLEHIFDGAPIPGGPFMRNSLKLIARAVDG